MSIDDFHGDGFFSLIAADRFAKRGGWIGCGGAEGVILGKVSVGGAEPDKVSVSGVQFLAPLPGLPRRKGGSQ